jgi:DNA-binding transcriptional LysR family regulator
MAMLAQADNLRASARAEEGQLAGRLTIGCYAPLTPILIPLLVAGFTEMHPAVKLELIEGLTRRNPAQPAQWRV